MKIQGWDQYGGGGRTLTAETEGPLVLITVEGSEGRGAVMLTPNQTHALALALSKVADQAAKDTLLEDPPVRGVAKKAAS